MIFCTSPAAFETLCPYGLGTVIGPGENGEGERQQKREPLRVTRRDVL